MAGTKTAWLAWIPYFDAASAQKLHAPVRVNQGVWIGVGHCGHATHDLRCAWNLPMAIIPGNEEAGGLTRTFLHQGIA